MGNSLFFSWYVIAKLIVGSIQLHFLTLQQMYVYLITEKTTLQQTNF